MMQQRSVVHKRTELRWDFVFNFRLEADALLEDINMIYIYRYSILFFVKWLFNSPQWQLIKNTFYSVNKISDLKLFLADPKPTFNVHGIIMLRKT